ARSAVLSSPTRRSSDLGAAALISCIFTDSLRVQSVIFVAVSILCLLALRPLAAKLRRPLTPTNGDLNIGRTATVLTPVTDDAPRSREHTTELQSRFDLV